MSTSSQHVKPSNCLHPFVILAMILSLFYWSYLGLTSQVIIFHDSFGYQNLGSLILKGPWTEYFVTGPNREPLYPILISISMRLAQWLNTDYLNIQTILQISIMVITQIFTARILKKLLVSDGLAALIILYIGCSPALVNSSLILFSEVLTYPLMLWLVLRAGIAWTHIKDAPFKNIIIHALLLALASLLITFTKGIFEIIIPLLLFPYVLLTLFAILRNKKETATRAFIFLLAFFLVYKTPIAVYKSLNKKHNGIYTLTDRGPVALYGNTARRMEPLSAQRIKTAIAYTFGADVCAKFYGEECSHWGFLTSDILGSEKSSALRKQGFEGQKLNDQYIKESLNLVFKNPPQYIFLTFLEGLKLFFWESPGIGYIVYPTSIANVYNFPWLHYPLRILIAILSMMALIFVVRTLYRNRKEILSASDGQNEKRSLELYLMLVTILYISFSSMFFLTPRYALPIAPLFLILIANFIQNLINKKRAPSR